MSFTPANIKSKRQIEDLFKEQLALLNASIENNMMIEDALDGKTKGVIPTMPLPVSREERSRDILFQQQKGLENLKKILNDPIEAGKALSRMDIGDILLLNRSAPFIIQDFSTKYADADADFFLKYLKRLIETQTSTKGLLNQMIASADIKEKKDDEDEPDEKWDLAELKTYKFPKSLNITPAPGQDADFSTRILQNQISRLEMLQQELLQKTQYLNDPKFRNSPEEKEVSKILNKIRKGIDNRLNKISEMEGEDGGFESATVFGLPEEEETKEGEEEETKEGEEEEEDFEGLRNFGLGLKRSLNKRVIIGRGLGLVQEEPRYVNFGKFVLHYSQLKNNNLNLKYRSLGGIPQIKPTKISNKFRDFLIDLIENKKISKMGYNMLDDKERKYFKKIIKFSQLDRTLGLKDDTEDQEESDDDDDVKEKMKRWELVKGQYMAGNNANSVKEELIKMIYEFTIGGQISKEEGEDLLISLFK